MNQPLESIPGDIDRYVEEDWGGYQGISVEIWWNYGLLMVSFVAFRSYVLLC
jgi:hypothetical protein